MKTQEQPNPTYIPLTVFNRIVDTDLSPIIKINEETIELPKCLLQKDVHYFINSKGEAVRAAWITSPLAHLLNSFRVESPRGKYNETIRALDSLDTYIAGLVEHGVINPRRGPGAMSFCQVTENIPEDSIMISSRTYDKLCSINSRWKNTKTVVAQRFPNLGLETTKELKLIVSRPNTLKFLDDSKLLSSSIGSRIPNLREILESVEYEHSDPQNGVLDGFYLHPTTLKNCFEGDCDGDLLYLVARKKGSPRFTEINLGRTPQKIEEEEIETMFLKARRTDRTKLQSWIVPYFDDVPIGEATYSILWDLYLTSRRCPEKKHPMQYAWKYIAKDALELIEFVMDIRKNSSSEAEITSKLASIKTSMKMIKTAKENKNWYALTVTASSLEEVGGFVRRFSTLQEYLNFITCQGGNSLV